MRSVVGGCAARRMTRVRPDSSKNEADERLGELVQVRLVTMHRPDYDLARAVYVEAAALRPGAASPPIMLFDIP